MERHLRCARTAVRAGHSSFVTRRPTSKQNKLQNLTRALDYVSEGVVSLDPDWTITYLNPRSELLLRKRRAELMGRVWWELFPYLLGTPGEEELRRAASRKESQMVRIFHSTLYAWHNVWVVPSKDGILLVIRDATDVARLLQQEAVREGVREVIGDIPIAISLLRGPDHRIELMNSLSRQLLGGRDLEGQTVRNALPELEGQGLLELLDEVYRSGKPFEGNGITITYDRAGNGQMYTGVFNTLYQPILGIDGTVSGVMSISVEVTDAGASPPAGSSEDAAV